MDFAYIEAPPDKWTFSPDSVRKYVEGHLQGRVLNLFAGETKLRHDKEVVRVDIDDARDADYHFDAMNVDEHFEDNAFGTVILDPPYNVRKSREKYNQELKLKFTIIRDKVTPLVKPGGKVLSFGYDSTGMSKSRGFEKEEIALLNHKGTHDDTICVVERMGNANLNSY